MNVIELEIARHLFASIAEEMGAMLMRSAFSPNIKERRDYSCALFDAAGEMVAQAAHIPVHLGSTPMSVAAAIAAFPEGIPAGEHVLLNDPYQGGTHLPDLTLVSPVYDATGALRFYVANRAHHADVGGISPGSLPLSRTLEEEGFCTGPRLLDAALEAELYAASRTPDERRGDLLAQVASNRRGATRLLEQLEQRGEWLIDAAQALQEYTARATRAEIARMPDGQWRYEDVLEDDGFGHEGIAIRCTLTVEGERICFDFGQSDPQVEGPLNVPRAVTVSAVLYGMRCLLTQDVPVNGGVMWPIEVITREGTIVEAMAPAAVAAGNVETSQRITDVVLGVLGEALPERLPAQSCGTMNNVLIGGRDERPQPAENYAYYETIGGGSGGAPDGPGASGIQTHMTNTLNTPVEVLELAYPFQVTRYRLREGSAGVGRHRGGEGIERAYRFLGDATVTLMTERRRVAPRGAHGGGAGGRGENVLVRDGVASVLPAKVTFEVGAGDEVVVRTPGGGGWGSPGE